MSIDIRAVPYYMERCTARDNLSIEQLIMIRRLQMSDEVR